MPTCCGRTFTHNGMRNHLDNSGYHADEIECGWCFARWPAYDDEARLEHEQEEHWLPCQQCDFIFKNDDALNQHVKDAHPPPYCYVCQREFNNENNLNMHMKSSVHVGRNVKCPKCTSKFTNWTGVSLHLESGSCSSGANRQKLNQYCREIDRNHVFTNKQIGWHDDQSSKNTTYATSAAWDGHWFRCYFCTKGFGKLNSLNQHLASPAHQQKIYHCPRCKKEYVALSGLVNHLENESCGAFRFNGMGSSKGLGFVKQLTIMA